MPKPASHITITGSDKRRRSRKPKPTKDKNLRAWRIRLIKSTWQRVTARKTEAL